VSLLGRRPILTTALLITLPLSVDGQTTASSFKVSGQHDTSLALLVPKETNSARLRALVLSLRDARRRNDLAKVLPPTTQKGAYGPYAVVVVYVFSEERWATSTALKECTEARGGSPLDMECTRHIRAYYMYAKAFGRQPEHEEGSVGYAEGSQVRSRPYEKLF
jgi:hypothetical protein